MKKTLLAFAVVGIMIWGAALSFNYDADATQSSTKMSDVSAVQSGSSSKIASVILPYSDESKDEREKFLAELKLKTNPKRIVIVTANHTSNTAEDILVNPEIKQTAESKIVTDREVYDNIVSSEMAVSDAAPFSDEKGINNIIDGVYSSFPKAVYTTLIIPKDVSKVEVQSLAEFFSEGDPEAMIIASVDFSQNIADALFDIHKTFTIQALTEQNSDNLWQSRSDSQQSLLLASLFAKGVDQKSFHQFSQALAANDTPQTAKTILGYYDSTEGEQTSAEVSTFIIAGDAMFDRNVWHNYKDKGLDTIFDKLGSNFFAGVDLSLLNLEGPISSKEIDDDYKSGSMVFNFPPVVPQVLKNLGIKSVSLANNHSSNAGATGFANTQKVLGAEGISYFGRQTGFNAEQDILRQDGAVPISIIAVDALATYDDKALVASIKKEKSDGRFVIIMPHWGTEYRATHDSSQRSLAVRWIAAGADMIIGSHPHVVEDFEIIDGVPVVYSLGNFVFDQFFSEETQRGLIMAGKISKDKISLTFVPTKEVLVKPQILQGNEKKTAIAKIFDIETAQGFIKISDDTIEINR